LTASTLRVLAADTTAASVSEHLSVISWFSGTFACASKITYSNGKTETAKFTVSTSKPENGWLHFTERGAPGIDYYGYDPKKGKYIVVGIGGAGDYAADYFTVGKDRSISLAFNNELSSTSYYAGNVSKMTPSANGYTLIVSGPTHIHPGLRFQERGECVRQ
jgi:hypothetical protein